MDARTQVSANVSPTANTLNWVLLHLANNAEAQERLFEEVSAALRETRGFFQRLDAAAQQSGIEPHHILARQQREASAGAGGGRGGYRGSKQQRY